MSTKKSTLGNITIPPFTNPALLETALTHRSALNEGMSHSTVSNERFEFLGDAVLELVTTNYLFAQCQEEPEGVLTAYRSALVKTTTLAKIAIELNLGNRLFLSRGEEGSGGRTNPGLLADTLEAVIGAIYLDQGFSAAEKFIRSWMPDQFQHVIQAKSYKDPKSELQELVQAKKKPTPEYIVLSETGPDHDKVFVVQVTVGGQVIGQGSGRSKQLAQQEAAKVALQGLV